MPITKRAKDGVTILEYVGRLTIENSHELRGAVAEALDNGAKKIVLHLGGVATIDSSGIGELISSYTRTTNQGGKLKLAAVTGKLNDLLYITKLITVFEVYDTEDEAVKSFA